MELPKRKTVRLRGFDYRQSGAYFVTICTKSRKCLLSNVFAAPTLSTVIGQMKRLVSLRIGVSLWQKSYYDHIVRGQADHDAIWEYIDNNPAKWADDRFYTT